MFDYGNVSNSAHCLSVVLTPDSGNCCSGCAGSSSLSSPEQQQCAHRPHAPSGMYTKRSRFKSTCSLWCMCQCYRTVLCGQLGYRPSMAHLFNVMITKTASVVSAFVCVRLMFTILLLSPHTCLCQMQSPNSHLPPHHQHQQHHHHHHHAYHAHNGHIHSRIPPSPHDSHYKTVGHYKYVPSDYPPNSIQTPISHSIDTDVTHSNRLDAHHPPLYVQAITHSEHDSPSQSSSSSEPHSMYSHHVFYPTRPTELSQTKCVERCSCKWRSGKMWVECLDVALHTVPRGLDSGTQVLYLSGNPLAELEARVFERASLRNLQRLYLANCRLHNINSDAFQQLSNLIELDLAHNELTNMPTNSLVHCPILRKLSLARNQIRAIKNSAFAILAHLQSIDLSGNGIELIDTNAFYGLKNLKQLYLHENKLR